MIGCCCEPTDEEAQEGSPTPLDLFQISQSFSPHLEQRYKKEPKEVRGVLEGTDAGLLRGGD